ncbi:hypothetical protein F5Y11DRAFT_321310 [Daldinia sp. FL1419]|nr:hypothetical protein F5Y11DRAFT_321310 [Daldinia sp. FL1419]
MANLPSQHPHLSLHLTDRALTPLISSSSPTRSPSRLEALTSLSHAALSAHESALRLGLGAPLRVMVEHDTGPIVLQSFLRADTSPTLSHSGPAFPPSTPHTTIHDNDSAVTPSRPSTSVSSTTAADPDVGPNGASPSSPTNTLEHRLQQLQLPPEPEPEDTNAPPMLVSIVVAPSADEARDARRAAARLERVGRAIQAQWAEVQGLEDGGAGD